MSADASPLQMARAALAASTQVDDPEVACFYVASARIAFSQACEELKATEHVLLARERALEARRAPRQLAIAEVGKR
jgi:hypothetical protein